MEVGPAAAVLGGDGRHPYTEALLASMPRAANLRPHGRLPAIEGEVLDTINVPRGCRFRARCQRIHDGVRARCAEHEPALAEVAPGRRVRCWLHQA
jgi:oligopeptide/dipeptide ABC transporter ATP-binding protein